MNDELHTLNVKVMYAGPDGFFPDQLTLIDPSDPTHVNSQVRFL